MRTLEEMLDTVNGSSQQIEKTAAAPEADLVGRLRKAAGAEAPEQDNAELRVEVARELAEKTAEISVIALTLAEIEQAINGGEKTASVAEPSAQQQRTATFIKMALEKGYQEGEIAAFLKEAAAFGSPFERAGIAMRRAIGHKAGSVAKNLGDTVKASEVTLLRKAHATGDPGKMHSAIERVGKLYPSKTALETIREAGIEVGEHPAYKKIVASMPHHLGIEIGGKTYGMSRETAGKAALPAAGIAGLAIGRASHGGKGQASAAR
jgi:hypothetical protein